MTFDEYKEDILGKLKNGEDIKLVSPILYDKEDKTGSTEYFVNTSKYYDKWVDFFNKIREVVRKKVSTVDIYEDTDTFMKRMYDFLAWTDSGKSYFRSYMSTICECVYIVADVRYEYKFGESFDLIPLVHTLDLDFLGWYDNKELTGDPITSILSTDKGDKVLYPKWEDEIKPSEIFLNEVAEMERYQTYQLTWEFNPIDTTDKRVEFSSSNKGVARIDAKTGLITAVKDGKTIIQMTIIADETLNIKFELEVYSPGQVIGSYDTTSYVAVNDVIKLNAALIGRGTSSIVWESKDENIAMVDAEGNVSGLNKGNTYIVAKDKEDESIYLEYLVTVVEQEVSDELQLLLDSHNSNIFTSYKLGVGSGTPEYYIDIFGSTTKLLANYNLVKNDKYYATTQQTAYNGGLKSSTEFITVHYTGNMKSGANASANASYFSGTKDASIHYVTGNDGVFYCTDEKYVAFHAGDGSDTEFKWYDTGVSYKEGDPEYPVFTISNDFYYELNGEKTSVKVPSTWDYKDRNTDHIFNSDGTISSKPGFSKKFTNRPAEEFINDQGLPFKVENGKYYMGTTWWCYTQVSEGRICSKGGNLNSIGIESCVDKGSDIWYTWQITAKLVVDIMLRYNLDITRVRGHHFFSGKDCPQPMLENDLEIWWEFVELVKAEYNLAKNFEGFTLTTTTTDTTYIKNNGRVKKQPDYNTCVSYTITLSNGETEETITLGSMLEGRFSV